MDAPVVLVGVSAAVRSIQEDVRLAVSTCASVLISGEVGVGKRAIARLVHECGRGIDGGFVQVDGARAPESEVAMALAGVFPANSSQLGTVDQEGRPAQTGTVFIRDVGRLGPQAQQLLLTLTSRSSRPRLMASSDVNLMHLVQIGAFLEELYYRLNVVHIVVPPLRERRPDIPVLLARLCQERSRQRDRPSPVFSADAMDCLVAYRWPGNLDELSGLVDQLVTEADRAVVAVDDLPEQIVSGSRAPFAEDRRAQSLSSV